VRAWAELSPCAVVATPPRNEEALEKYQEVKEKLKALEARSEWAEIPIVKTCIQETKERGEQFVRAYKERVTTRQVEDAIRACSSALNTAKDMLSHHRHDECLVSIQKCKDLTEALASDSMLNSMPAASQWLATYAEEIPALQRKHSKVMLDRAVADAIRAADSEFGFMQGHFDHYRFEHALQSLAKYRDLVKAIENESSFNGHPAIEEFLKKSDVAVPEFEKKYVETMLQREYDEAVRLASGELGTANDLFQHHRYDESLVSLHKYRASIDAIRSREAFSAIAARDAYVKEALEVKIPEWQAKYKETVLGRKGDDLARELGGLVNTAKEHLSHHRHEQFLAACQNLKDKANEAEPTSDTPEGSDQRLMLELPQVKSALTSAYADLHLMSQEYDAKMLERKIDEAIRAVDSSLTTAKDMLFHSRFEESLTAFSRARESEAELIGQNFASSEKVTSHHREFAQAAKEFQSCDHARATASGGKETRWWHIADCHRSVLALSS
jgi:hypothetical protein